MNEKSKDALFVATKAMQHAATMIVNHVGTLNVEARPDVEDLPEWLTELDNRTITLAAAVMAFNLACHSKTTSHSKVGVRELIDRLVGSAHKAGQESVQQTGYQARAEELLRTARTQLETILQKWLII